MRLICLTFIACIIFLSCKKNTTNSESFFNCGYQILDSSVLVNKLYGNWKWIKTRSGMDGKIRDADAQRILTFRTDSTFSYIEGATILAQGKWSLKLDPGTSYWNLNKEPASYYLVGSVFICNNQLELFYSYLDAEDILFERID